jgi:hypothetical protein
LNHPVLLEDRRCRGQRLMLESLTLTLSAAGSVDFQHHAGSVDFQNHAGNFDRRHQYFQQLKTSIVNRRRRYSSYAGRFNSPSNR